MKILCKIVMTEKMSIFNRTVVEYRLFDKNKDSATAAFFRNENTGECIFSDPEVSTEKDTYEEKYLL